MREDKLRSAIKLLDKSVAMEKLGIISPKELENNIKMIRERLGYNPLKKRRKIMTTIKKIFR